MSSDGSVGSRSRQRTVSQQRNSVALADICKRGMGLTWPFFRVCMDFSHRALGRISIRTACALVADLKHTFNTQISNILLK